MTRATIATLLTVMLLTPISRSLPSLAQGRPATELVCVGRGGESIVVEEWTREQIDGWEAEWGRRLLRANPETGTCADPAGLPVWWDGTQDFRYECAQDAQGLWYGPAWSGGVGSYHNPANVPPDPATDSCPLPHAAWPSPPETEKAAALEVYFSQLIAKGDWGTLYQWMHPDSRAHISETAMAGWFTANVAPTKPTAEVVDKVRFVDWTWGVTGRTYPLAAEISVHYQTADGVVHIDVAHLVRDNGVWRWLFGRDAAFVADVQAKYGR